MSAIPEGGDLSEIGSVSGTFAKIGPLGVVHCDHLSCSTEAKANAPSVESSVVEARFGPSSNFKLSYESVEIVSHFSKCSEGFVDVLWVCIGTCVREVRERCFSERESLVGVTFCGSSKLERICAYAFSETSVESLSIPESVVELGEGCFSGCKGLRSVIFGASSKLERICGYAFCGTSVESLSIPESVVELGKRCFYRCKGLRSVIFGASSKLERIWADAFSDTSVESLSIPESVVTLT